jgi:hypothetical protein
MKERKYRKHILQATEILQDCLLNKKTSLAFDGVKLNDSEIAEVFSPFANDLAPLQHIISIQFHDTGIQHLPDWIPKLPSLEELGIYERRLVEIPDWILEIPTLKVLELWGMGLMSEPDFGKLPSLEQLSYTLSVHGDVSDTTKRELGKMILYSTGWEIENAQTIGYCRQYMTQERAKAEQEKEENDGDEN